MEDEAKVKNLDIDGAQNRHGWLLAAAVPSQVFLTFMLFFHRDWLAKGDRYQWIFTSNAVLQLTLVSVSPTINVHQQPVLWVVDE